MADINYPENSAPSPPGFNGKRLTIVVGGSLAAATILFGYIMWLYGEVERAADKTEAAWRTAAIQLETRYAKLEKLVASGVDQRLIAMELGEQFRLKIDAFRATSQSEAQVAIVLEFETLIAQISQSLAAIPAAEQLAAAWQQAQVEQEELHSTLEVYNAKVKEQEQWRESLGGSLLLAFIKLSQPSEVRVATDLPNSRIQ